LGWGGGGTTSVNTPQHNPFLYFQLAAFPGEKTNNRDLLTKDTFVCFVSDPDLINFFPRQTAIAATEEKREITVK
jgi:hypothetical protein